MAEARLTGKDKRALVLWIICGIVGAVFAQRFFFRAFPEASVDFKVSRSEAQARAKNFVEALGENLKGYQSTITFDVAENAKTYLEREMGLQEANRLMSSELNIWYWDVRFFRPQQEEEFDVRVNPAGKVVAYDHKVEEARKAESRNREEALSNAKDFLQSKLGTDLNTWEFLPAEANSTTRPNRLDWSFTWERKGFKAKEAPYRLEVGLQGDRIGNTREFLRVPEAWSRDYRHLRSTNDLYEWMALIPYLLLLGSVTWLGISLARQGKTSWSGAIKLGAIVALLFFFMQVNQWEAVRAGYNTHGPYSGYILKSLVLLFLEAIATALTVTLVLPGSEPLYRAAQPERMKLSKAFSVRGLCSKEFFSSAVVGLSLAAAHIGFIVAFYMIGSRHGVWAPQDLNYSDVVNTSFPWISGVAIGLLAATSEEFLFRLFAIPFLHKLTGSRVLAVLLPAFMWGFLHSNYPQEPGYIRGIEVGLIGIVAGLVMLRWGILATLIWHYTVDALLVGMLLIRSDNLYFKISGFAVGLAAVAPLLFSGVLYLFRRRFESVDDLLNGAEPAPEIDLSRQTVAEESALSVRRYTPLTSGTIGFLVICLLLGGLMAWKSKREQIGDYLNLTTNPHTATNLADAVMREHGQNPSTFRKAMQFVDILNLRNQVINEYLRRRMPVSAINQLYAERVPGALWHARYFREGQKEEFAVTLKPDGSFHAFWHELAEDAKGADLPKDQAVALAERFLREKKQIDPAGWKLVEAKSDKRPNRTDHTLTWQQMASLDPDNSSPKDLNDHAYARMEMQILGDEPVNYRTYIKIPEEFKRKQEEESLPRTLFFVGRLLLGIGLFAAVLFFYFKKFRTRPIAVVPWRRMLLWGSVGSAAFVLSLLFGNMFSNDFAGYPTEYPLKIYYAALAVRYLVSAATVLGALVLFFGLAWFFAARAFGEEQIPTWLGMPGEYYRDAFWIAMGGSAFLIGLRRLLDSVPVWWPTLHRALPANIGDIFDARLPGLAIIGSATQRALLASAIVVLAAAFLGAELRVRWLRILLFMAIAAEMVFNWGSAADFLQQFLAKLILLAFVVFGIRRVVRFNLLGLFLVACCTTMLGGGLELLAQPDAFYRRQGYLVMAALVMLLAWPLLAWRTSHPASVTEGAA